MNKTTIERLKEVTDIQCSDGNWNYDPYMHGMANGMIMALSMMEGKEPEFLSPPDEWLSGHSRNIEVLTSRVDDIEELVTPSVS